MVRVPSCEKMGMKKGPWTPEEDQILISYIHRYGHANWRALPQQAGLLRCGKSCRRRWINYLRPDIKRGNFTTEEEETILKLHQSLGNRWSAIAASLQGRTDNEIKNYWHSHLKKRLKQAIGSTTEMREIEGARMELQHQKPSISSPNSMQSSACLAVTTTTSEMHQPKEFALAKQQQQQQQQRQGIDDQLKLSDVSMAETIKNNGFNNDIDANNNRDFWYKLLMENSNE